MLEELLLDYNPVIIDAASIKSANALLAEIIKQKGTTRVLYKEIERRLTETGLVLVLKNLSLSRVSDSGWIARDLFKSCCEAMKTKKIQGSFVANITSDQSDSLKLTPWELGLWSGEEEVAAMSSRRTDQEEALSSIILVDFPSYLEKNFEPIGHYVTPVYLLDTISGVL